MNSALISQIIEKITADIKQRNDNFVKFSNKDYNCIRLDQKNFHELSANIDDKSADKTLIFIDGGNQEIISSPSFSLQLMRIAAVTYKDKKKISALKSEFYALMTSKIINEEINFCAEFYQISGEKIFEDNIIIDSMEKTLRQGNKRVGISQIGNVIRRYAEIIYAKENAAKDSIIVLDGTLECEFVGEYELFEKLYEKVKENNALICALSKTTSMYTDSGNSIMSFLSKAPFKSWYYFPITDMNISGHRADMYFVKLHASAQYDFRFEVHNKIEYNLTDILLPLMKNSKDPVFFGYPYGLVEADRIARVTNKEIEFLRAMLETRAGAKYELIVDSIKAKNAHGILDNIS